MSNNNTKITTAVKLVPTTVFSVNVSIHVITGKEGMPQTGLGERLKRFNFMKQG